MEEKKLKEVVDKLHIKKEMEEEILKNIRKAEEEIKIKGSKKKWNKAVAAVAALAVTAVVGGISVNALVDSLVKDRMQHVPQETLEEMVEELDTANTAASGYSREFTQSEVERQRELAIAYQNGTFPKEEMTRVKKMSQIDKNTLCYVSGADYFNIPERELTDEELLQYIDFEQKMDYALDKRYKEMCADEIRAQKEAEEALVAENEEKGGISKQEAIAKSEEWLNVLYGKTSDGMEVDWCIEKSGDNMAVYQIEYSAGLYSTYSYDSYSIYINGNGELVGTFHGGSNVYGSEERSMDEAKEAVGPLYEKAEEFLKDTFGISEEFEEVYCRYFENESGDGVVLNRLNFWFVKEDRMAYRLTFSCDTNEFLELMYENYDENVERNKEFKGVCEKLK